jgi:hypothetical protein
MRLPKVHGVIRRRLLVNFRVDPEVIARQLQAPFRPKLYRDTAIAGICLIRLEEIRPKGFPKLAGRPANALPASSIFPDAEAASAFFEPGSVGFPATASGQRLDQVVLTTHRWAVSPLDMERVHSSYFAGPERFPPGSATFDCTLVMRNVAHEWHEGPSLYL